MQELAREMARLAAGTLDRHAAFVGAPAFVPAAEPFFAHLVRQADEAGALEVHRRGGRLTGFLVAWHEAASHQGVPVTHAILHLDAADAEARAWAEACLVRGYATFGDDLLLELDGHYAGLLPALEARGYRVDSVVLGRPLAGLAARLQARSAGPLPPGVALRPIRDEADVAAIVAMQRDAYTATPEFCAFGATEPHLADVAQGLREGLGGASPHFVLEDGDAVVGYVGAAILDPNLYWGRCAVGDVVFADRVRGRGLLGPCTAHLVAALEARQVRTVLSPTAQPPVMAIARRAGAAPLAWMVRRRSPFAPSHFDHVRADQVR